MSESIFIKIDGIKGESLDKHHKDEIDVLSWSWGVENTAGGGGSGGGGGGAGKAQFEAFSFTHVIDAASPELMKLCATGKHVKQAVLTTHRAGKGHSDFLVITLHDVRVSSVMLDADPDMRVESVELNFAKVEYIYTPQTPKGSAGTPVRFGFDLKTNKVI
jgi:type VI secretion system secreted protein Hcp